MQFKHLLAPVDLSEHSGPALQLAGLLAHELSARHTCLYVRGLEQSETAINDARRQLTDFVKTWAVEGSDPAEVITQGPAPYVTADWAERHQADMIICGRHGQTGYGRVLLGGFAEKIVRLTRCPVWMVRSPAPAYPPRRILFPTDLSSGSDPAQQLAFFLARTFGAELCLLHVVSKPQLDFGNSGDLEAFYDNARALAEKRLALCGQDEPTHCTKLIEIGMPAEKAIDVANNGGYDLVVCGSGPDALKRMVMGSVAEQLVRLAPCSVVTVPWQPPEIKVSVQERSDAQP